MSLDQPVLWLGLAGFSPEQRQQLHGLLAQLPKQVRATGVRGQANYLAMASGYFEGHADAAQPPSVLSKIVASLKERDANEEPALLLKPKAEIDVYVNPQACQSVAACADSMARQRWTCGK